MKYQIVLQFNGKTEEDFNELIEIEDVLEEKLQNIAEIDGHDFGSKEMNIFILTDEPKKTFKSIQQILKDNKLFACVRAAFREIISNEYNILWPISLKKFSVK